MNEQNQPPELPVQSADAQAVDAATAEPPAVDLDGPPPPPPDKNDRQFPCKNCGADVKFKPGTSALACPYCGEHNAIPQSEEDIVEIDLRAALADLASQGATQEHTDFKCDACGAQVTKPPDVTAMPCPFCGSSIVGTASSGKQLKPASLLPFAVDRKQGRELFKRWINGLWFAPGALKKLARVDDRLAGIYVPYWTYDSRTTTFYRGSRGEHYWTTESYTTRENGKTVRKTRRVRKTRWWPCSGTVWNTFDDVLVVASRSLPTKHAEKLEPWDLRNLQPYDDAFLSGFQSQSYQVELDQGFERAKELMAPHIRATINRDIGGDEQRIHSTRTQYDDVTFKHILLPIWISAYRYQNKVYRFLVNGRTGEVQGERPWSVLKIVLAGIAALTVFGGVAAVLMGVMSR